MKIQKDKFYRSNFPSGMLCFFSFLNSALGSPLINKILFVIYVLSVSDFLDGFKHWGPLFPKFCSPSRAFVKAIQGGKPFHRVSGCLKLLALCQLSFRSLIDLNARLNNSDLGLNGKYLYHFLIYHTSITRSCFSLKVLKWVNLSIIARCGGCNRLWWLWCGNKNYN